MTEIQTDDGVHAVAPDSEADVTADNRVLMAPIEIANGDVNDLPVGVSTNGKHIIINIAGYDTRAVFSIEEMVGAAFEHLDGLDGDD